MRLKLVLLAALLGTLLGAGVPIAIFAATVGWRAFSPDKLVYQSGSWFLLLVYLPPLIAAALAGFFVYRHTARHRKLQAALTGILVLALCVVAYFVTLLLVPAIR
jgi:hypothetical protein